MGASQAGRHEIGWLLVGICAVATSVATRTSQAQEPSAGSQVEQNLALENGQVISFLLYLPKEYQADSQDSKLPLMLFLHGRGESNGPLSLVAKWGPPQIVAEGGHFPFILVSPQCPADDNWRSDRQQEALVKLLDAIVEKYPVDEDRIYLTGLSMGGYGSWRLAADHPDRFAAVVPICGGGNPQDAEKLKTLPIWVWHGDQDRAVALERSEAMVEAIRSAGSEKVRFTVLEHIGHNSWSAAYATPELYSWLLGQRASRNRGASEGGQ